MEKIKFTSDSTCDLPQSLIQENDIGICPIAILLGMEEYHDTVDVDAKKVIDYVKETGNHVMYRVTPIFEGKNLVASGVQMEAYSVEDNGKGVCFNIYVYNVQPGITINYATGENWLTTTSSSQSSTTQATGTTYILNTGSKKIHLPTCSSSSTISEKNRKEYTGSINDLLSQGYTTCGGCKPK